MAVLEHVELAVDGGGVTVARRLAYYSYGKFDVVLPEGREQVEFDDRIQNGYISRSPGARMGRFDFGFIRADATVNLESGTSDLELAIDSTLKRSEGDVFVERDVPPAGLRGHRPGVDFGLDDLVFLRVWGNRLRLPVTAVDMSASVGDGPHGSRVHLGGQLVSDGETRRRANNEILLQIAQEKRQRLRQVNAETANRKAAVAAEARRSDAYADSVAAGVESRLSSSFEASYERYSKALSQLGDTWRRELQEGLSAEQRARVEALRQEQQAREKAGTDLRGELEKSLGDAVAGEARARQKAISDLSQSFTTELQTYGELVKEAKNYVDPATQQVVNFWSKENQNNFNKAVQLTLSAQAAYNDVNNIKWVSQDAWNEQQQKINEARTKFEAQQIEINTQRAQFEEAQKRINELQSALDQEQDLRLKATELATSALSRDATRIMYIPRDTVALADSSMIGLNMPDINRRIWFGALKSWRGKAIINVNYSSGSIRVYQVESKNLGFEGKQIGELYKAFPEGSILKYSAIDIPPGDVNSVTIFWQTYNG